MFGELGIWRIVAANVDCLALRGEEFLIDFLLIVRQGFCQRCEVLFQGRVLVLRGDGLRPVEGEIEVAAPVVKFVHLSGG